MIFYISSPYLKSHLFVFLLCIKLMLHKFLQILPQYMKYILATFEIKNFFQIRKRFQNLHLATTCNLQS